MRDILLEHWKRYPAMEIQDMVKLLFQSEFGGGHMILDSEVSLRRLKEEHVTARIPAGQSVWEDIGGGLCRVYLDKEKTGLKAETINRMFVATANSCVGSRTDFELRLSEFLELCRQGILPYPPNQVEDYLLNYKRQGYPAVSHSQNYRDAYHPAYRVVEAAYMECREVYRFMDAMLGQSKQSPIVVAIDGMGGGGKSTLGTMLSAIYDCNLFHMDHFFLRPEQRTEERLREAGGNVDYERFKAEILDGVMAGKSVSYRPYDCSRQCLSDYVEVEPQRLNIVEGVYSQHPYFGDVYDLRFFLELSGGEQIRRIRERNGEQMLERFSREWIPMEHQYFRQFQIRENSVVIAKQEHL